MDPSEVARRCIHLPVLHPEVLPALPGQGKLGAQHHHVVAVQPRSTCSVPERLVLAPVGKYLSTHLDVADRSNRLPKGSDWSLC